MEPTDPRALGSRVDACVGTGDAGADDAAAPSSPSPCLIGIHGMIELRVQHDGRSLDPSRDIASLVFGRAAGPLVTRLRWAVAIIGILGGPTPVLVTFALHWASAGVGQFALAYPWPLWLEAWWCVGWWSCAALTSLLYASLQRELAWMALKQPSTLWIIAMSGLWTAGFVSLYDFGIHRSAWVNVPVHIVCMLLFPLVALADALPPRVRLSVLRFIGPFILQSAGAVALVLRLPTAEGTPGKLVWTVMGTDTLTNLQVITYSATVIALLVAEGVIKAWLFPNELAFIRAGLKFRVARCGAAVANGAAVASVVDEAPGVHTAVVLVQEDAAHRARSVPKRSGSSVHPAQPEFTLIQLMSDTGNTVEGGCFTSAVRARVPFPVVEGAEHDSAYACR